jgi:hypothetical protein
MHRRRDLDRWRTFNHRDWFTIGMVEFCKLLLDDLLLRVHWLKLMYFYRRHMLCNLRMKTPSLLLLFISRFQILCTARRLFMSRKNIHWSLHTRIKYIIYGFSFFCRILICYLRGSCPLKILLDRSHRRYLMNWIASWRWWMMQRVIHFCCSSFYRFLCFSSLNLNSK